jgi:tripartite ATP-independent transporter DctM subunit
MEWWLTLIVIICSLIFLMVLRIPISFCFLLVDLVGAFLVWGGTGPEQLVLSIAESLNRFAFLPIPLFFIMGTVLFQSGLAPKMIDAADKWLGRLRGRLSLLAVAAGTLIGALSGMSVAATMILGTSLVPEMEKRGYKKEMSIGPIVGGGGLDIMIPPSSLAVLLAALAEISVGKMLIATILPGILMAVLYGLYIVVRCRIQPSLAPSYEVQPLSFKEKLVPTARYILPTSVIIFLVVGLIFLGVATPDEAAASGALGTILFVSCYGALNWKVLKSSLTEALYSSVMILTILVGAAAFSQLLAFTGATSGLVKFALGLSLEPIQMLIVLQIIVLILGCFLEPGSLLMIAIPLFMPIVRTLGINDIWFGVLTLLSVESGMLTPPVGLNLYVMRGVAPPGTTMHDIIWASFPFLILNIIATAILIVFPPIVSWLPELMK